MISAVTFSEPMAAVVGHVAPVMKANGFRKRRHSFNRGARDGIVHHLSFQMGAFDPPGTVEIPGLRPNLYGKFTVNLGVFVPAMSRMGAPRSDWINDSAGTKDGGQQTAPVSDSVSKPVRLLDYACGTGLLTRVRMSSLTVSRIKVQAEWCC